MEDKTYAQEGFIPMIVVFLLVIVAVIYLAFTQVLNHQK
jgi:Tfp pilus assembly protein PilX